MFCVECGSEDKVYGHLCKNCLLSKNLITPPDYIEVHVCLGCARVLSGGSVWKKMAHEDEAATVLAAASKSHVEAKELRWEVPSFPADKGEHRVLCTAISMIGGEELAIDFEIGIRIRFQQCQSCSRQSGDYYESIIQLRIDDLSVKDAEIELAEESALVFKMVEESSDENAFISKCSLVKGGMDFYIGSTPLARAIANKFRNRYGAITTESPSIIGMKDGRDMYRFSIAVRLPTHREGDVVALDKKIHVVESSGKIITLKNVSNGQIVRLSPDAPTLKPVAKFHELKDVVVVTHDKTTIQVLDPDSMVAVTLRKPPYLTKIGETVPVVRYDNVLYVV
ncbi:MAG: NMD3-related protein [Thermoplasmata archaeon]|nr:NMD3-related protein [Thermoplasmata archaeon]